MNLDEHNGVWEQRRQLLERRLKGKKGRTGEYRSPLGELSEEPLKMVYSEEEGQKVYCKVIQIRPLKLGNRNLPQRTLRVEITDPDVNSCLNKAWDEIVKEWGHYWNPPAPGTPSCPSTLNL